MEIAEQPPISPQPLFKKRTTKSTLRKRPATPPPADDSDSSGYSSTSSESNNRKIKRQRKSAVITASTTSSSTIPPSNPDLSPTKHAGDRTSTLTLTNDATKTSNWFDEASEKDTTSKPNTTTSTTPNPLSENTYKGASSYTSFIQKNPNAPPRAGIGPIKAPTNIRTITVTDFAPDVCKDYKQTGFCGFGDSCKFLHAREDYKQGWELDKEWEKVGPGAAGGNKKGGKFGGRGQKTAQRQGVAGDGGEEEDEDALLEGIPFACIICKEGYKDPIVTKCGHYFCEKCALQRYRRSPSCAACGSGTGGVFNGAKGLRKLLERKRERARLRREKALENGEEVESEEEGEQ